MSKYGLQLRAPKPKQPALRKPIVKFPFGDDVEESVEEEIARQAAKKRSLREVEELHKRTLTEDPTAFDYDGVYDEMKAKQSQPVQADRSERKPKYIGKLMEKAKQRTREQDIIYERQLAKERAKEDHLFGDKEKFVTSAYKKKLAEEAKWHEEQRLLELKEQAEEVTKRSDLSDFYRNLLSKNVALGANSNHGKNDVESDKGIQKVISKEASELAKDAQTAKDNGSRMQETSMPSGRSISKSPPGSPVSMPLEASSSAAPTEANTINEPKEVATDVVGNGPPSTDSGSKVDAIAAAKARYLARKKLRS